MGEAWAGQVNAKLAFMLSWKVADFWAEENLGLEPPIGSMEKGYNFENSSYLNDGTGDPWAGQTNARLLVTMSSNATKFILEENFGLELPTGSRLGTKYPYDWYDYH